jgi:hypothetical protein
LELILLEGMEIEVMDVPLGYLGYFERIPVFLILMEVLNQQI